jgi:ComEC/Rec2-related protein
LAAGLASAFAWWHVLLILPLFFWLWDRRSVLVLVLFGVIGLLLRPNPNVELIYDARPFSGQIEIVSVPRPSAFGLQAEGLSNGSKYWIRGDSNWDMSLGDVVEARGAIEPLKEYNDPARGAVGIIQLDKEPVTVKRGLSFWRAGRDLQRSFSTFVKAHFEPAEAGMLDALCFSSSADIDPTLRLNIRRTGLSHVVAASGLQVTIMTVALFWLCLRLPLERRWQLLVLIPLLILYAGAAGLRASIVRALFMGIIALAAWPFRREPDGLAAIGAAGTLNLMIDPESICDLGFILSYSAMLGLVLFAPVKEGHTRGWFAWISKKAKEIFWSSLVAGAVTAPTIAYAFGEFSTVGLVANLLIVPVVPFATVGALLGWVVSFASPDLGALIVKGTAIPFIHWFTWVANTVGPLPASTMAVPWFSPYAVVIVWVMALMWWRPRVREAT